MPAIRVRALQTFDVGDDWIVEGELFYAAPADARKLQSEGKVEMILSRYPERLDAIEDEAPGWTLKKPCKDCPDKKKE